MWILKAFILGCIIIAFIIVFAVIIAILQLNNHWRRHYDQIPSDYEL